MASQALRAPKELVAFLLNAPRYSNLDHNLAAIEHRQNLIKLWGIPPGARVLEIGCGQGDCTVPLADAVGPSGRVVALDPAPPDYGTPPVGDAHAHIKASPVGPQIEFVRAGATAYLQSTTQTFDFIVLAHCVWYFSEPAGLREILTVAAAGARSATVLIAEYSLAASRPAAVPHVLATLATSALESFRDESSWRNVRCPLSPVQITAVAAAAGWELHGQETIPSPVGDQSGRRETIMILERPMFVADVDALEVSEKTKSMLLGMRDALAASVKMLAGQMDSVVDMDVWAGRFVLKGGNE
ncbi:S-adenosyl-L-methionine-dependent methyltransferase [Pleurostoma richardsiae]|uniref:S-adenosyl-L-methionine-dependent methyltransferase n=1 Tax=Pleurostoma richardsiae TaxID=41990 RepID=A0AA38RG52_9PEZI|nr:S-adenosyl-L-methionine-dependent methyltransferase [Pleurostoma richardsiae]